MTVATSPNRKHRFLRFSLRTLLLVMLVACVTLGWKVQRAKRQQQAVAWVQESGGTVAYGYEWSYKHGRVPIPSPFGPKWLRNQLGIDFFDHVVFVSVKDNEEVTDVTPLATLTSLEHLELDDTQVSDVTPLVGLTHLKFLSLDGTQVDDVTALAEMTSLDVLNLDATQVSDLTPLAGLGRLVVLELFDTQVSDVTSLAGLASLKRLELRSSPVKDVTSLSELTSLEQLDLSETQVSDVTPLARLTNLKRLDLSNTPVSQQDVEMLQKLLPNCRIRWSPDIP